MRARAKHILTIPAIALLISCAAAPAASGEQVAPLPASDYTVHKECATAVPGRAGCLSLALVALTPAAKAHTHPLGIVRSRPAAPSAGAGSFGLRPQDVHSVYSLPTSPPQPQTVAIVDAYNDPTAESDLDQYSKELGLPGCTAASGCFRKVNEHGETSPLPYPSSLAELEAGLAGSGAERGEAEEAAGWGVEISLDMEAVHATCETCHIVLVEADDPSFVNLETAERTADASGAGEISNSFGGPEIEESPEEELASAFNDPGTVVTASAGDAGYLAWDAESFYEQGYAEFPASSPHVVAVGGTRLSATSGSWAGESVWNGDGAGGGGCSVVFEAQPWQRAVSDWSSVGCSSDRAVADISADADPYTGLAVFDSSPACRWRVEAHYVHWCTIGGTSLASPLIAGVFALAGGAGSAAYPAQSLYANTRADPGALHDVVSGSNGECATPYSETGLSGCSVTEEGASCSQHLVCVAGTGYDGPTGLGTPNGLAAFDPNGSGAGEAGGNSNGTGGSEQQSPIQQAPVRPAPAPPTTTVPLVAVSPQLAGLALTVKALVALNRARPRMAAVAFGFSTNVIQTVRASLSRRARPRHHHHLRWAPVGQASTILAIPGRNSGHLGGRSVLRHGTYRLLLTPAHGAARAIEFKIG
ncbi:MAG TPA: S8 family serine peptidase [Solirubrobacteraceae bacterium]|nr:S8 family serine peptidase [Solirubrobacteraceae bacterium]